MIQLFVLELVFLQWIYGRIMLYIHYSVLYKNHLVELHYQNVFVELVVLVVLVLSLLLFLFLQMVLVVHLKEKILNQLYVQWK